jgi:hypothetical protein
VELGAIGVSFPLSVAYAGVTFDQGEPQA